MQIKLTDETILLRPFREEDIVTVHEAIIESFNELSKWMRWCNEDYTFEDTAAFVRSRDDAWKNEIDYSFAVFDRATEVFQASVGLSFVNRTYQMANLGYWVRTSATRKGIASRATRLLARFAFEELKLQRVEIVAAVENVASQLVAERAGAVREGIMRKRLISDHRATDAVMYSLVAEDLDLSSRS